MKNYFDNLDRKIFRIVRKIGKEADQRGVSVYVVGGTVRDAILRRKNFDLDIVVEGDAIQLARELAKSMNAQLTVHDQFGTASLELSSGGRIDFAITRREFYVHPGALPTVKQGTLKDDLQRRDFTINAMAIAIHRERFGQLTDLYGGVGDLSKKKIRILHDRSFLDDPTRIVRAVRFEQRFQFQIERHSLSLLKECVAKKITLNVKPQRYFNELKKILWEDDPVRSLKRLDQIGWIPIFDGTMNFRLSKLSSIRNRVLDVKQKPLYRTYSSWWMAYMLGLMQQCDPHVVKETLSKIHFTKNERESIRQIRDFQGIIKSLSSKGLPASQIYQILKILNKDAIVYLRVLTARPVIAKRVDKFLKRDAGVRLLINGNDLRRLGIDSGKRIGEILEQLLYLKIDQKIATRNDEIKQAKLLSQVG